MVVVELVSVVEMEVAMVDVVAAFDVWVWRGDGGRHGGL